MATTGKPLRGSIVLHKATFRSDEVDRIPFFRGLLESIFGACRGSGIYNTNPQSATSEDL